MLEAWIATTKKVVAHDKRSNTDYEFESRFPDGIDGTPFSAAEMNKIIGAVNALPNDNLLLDSHFRLWDEGTSFSGAYTSGGYTATLWWVKNLSGGTITVSRAEGGGMNIQGTGTVQVSQPIEDAQLLDGKTVTLSWSVDGVEHAKTYVFDASISNAATVEIACGGTINWVKLELGAYVTPCMPRPLVQEKQLAMRYFWQTFEGELPSGLGGKMSYVFMADVNGVADALFCAPMPMYRAPTARHYTETTGDVDQVSIYTRETGYYSSAPNISPFANNRVLGLRLTGCTPNTVGFIAWHGRYDARMEVT